MLVYSDFVFLENLVENERGEKRDYCVSCRIVDIVAFMVPDDVYEILLEEVSHAVVTEKRKKRVRVLVGMQMFIYMNNQNNTQSYD